MSWLGPRFASVNCQMSINNFGIRKLNSKRVKKPDDHNLSDNFKYQFKKLWGSIHLVCKQNLGKNNIFTHRYTNVRISSHILEPL